MIVIDEYLAVRVLGGDWPDTLPDDELGLPASRHWRLLQRVHNPAGGQLSRLLASLPGGDLGVVRWPHPEVLVVLDPRPLFDEAAILAARFGGTGLLVAETLTAGLTYGRDLWFGTPTNVGRLLERAADELASPCTSPKLEPDRCDAVAHPAVGRHGLGPLRGRCSAIGLGSAPGKNAHP